MTEKRMDAAARSREVGETRMRAGTMPKGLTEGMEVATNATSGNGPTIGTAARADMAATRAATTTAEAAEGGTTAGAGTAGPARRSGATTGEAGADEAATTPATTAAGSPNGRSRRPSGDEGAEGDRTAAPRTGGVPARSPRQRPRRRETERRAGRTRISQNRWIRATKTSASLAASAAVMATSRDLQMRRYLAKEIRPRMPMSSRLPKRRRLPRLRKR
mmetsp:Transcript_178217/g.571262  ORF Transcript_178217/g.571262 Transcript_178217/m.571262 type:complete len:219 (+) Transcript_178217:1179-1835(+)